MSADRIYYVWSCEHRAWWGPGRRGYVRGLLEAGQYTREQALDICRDAIPSSAHMETIAEIPVSKEDVQEFLAGQMIPSPLLHGRRER